MDECWKRLLSMSPWRESMKCVYCGRLEWRNMKSIKEFEQRGCMRCRLLRGNVLLSDDDMDKKKPKGHIVSGRYC